MNFLDPRLPPRFWSKCIPEPNAGCWLWLGGTSGADGYGKISLGGRKRFVHRVAYEVLIGPIPPGLQMDHLCRNEACCNPAHLEPVTSAVNTERGDASLVTKKRHSSITHCPNGHEYTEGNTSTFASGSARRYLSRHCKECVRVRAREYQRRRRGRGRP